MKIEIIIFILTEVMLRLDLKQLFKIISIHQLKLYFFKTSSINMIYIVIIERQLTYYALFMSFVCS